MRAADEKTKEMYRSLRKENEGRGSTPWPLVKMEMSLKETSPYWFRRLYMKEDYRKTVEAYGRDTFYARCYACLAFRIYGYRYMSNNERRMAGLKPLRTRRGRR